MTKLAHALKDSARLGLLLTIFFFAGIVTSAFILFMLPHDLVFKGHINNIDGAWGVLTPLFIVISVTFVFGIAAVTVGLLKKKETVVYLEKKKNATTGQTSVTDTTDENFNLLNFFKEKLQEQNGNVLETGLNILCKQLDAGQGALYITRQYGEKSILELNAGFAINKSESGKVQFEFGEGLVGQAALSGNSLYLDEVPEGYITILSGLGSASAKFLLLVVLKSGDETKGVMEIATFTPLKENMRKQIEEVAKILAEKIS